MHDVKILNEKVNRNNLATNMLQDYLSWVYSRKAKINVVHHVNRLTKKNRMTI